MSSGGDSRDTYTALGSPSLDTDADADAGIMAMEGDADYDYDSICSYASWCGGSNDTDIIGPITVGRVARDVKALLLNPLGSCDKIGRRRRRGGADFDRRHGGSFAEDGTISTWGSADGQTIDTYEEDDYSLASELTAEVVGGGGSRSVGSKKNGLLTICATVRQRDRAPPMPTCNEEDGEEDDMDGSDELTLSNRRKVSKSLNPQTPRTAGAAVVAAAGSIPLRRVMSDTSLSQCDHEVTVTQHRRQLSTENVPVASLPGAPRPSPPISSQPQIGASPTHITSFDNVIDLRTPKPIRRSKSFSKTETLKRRKEVEAKIRAEHRVAKEQRDKEKAIERAKLEALRSKQEKERRIAEAAEAEARRIEKEEARKLEEIEQRKHEAELAAVRKEQQREEERARKMEEKRLEAEAKAREGEERRNAQLAEAEQKRLDRETAKEQAKEQKLAAIAQKKAAAEEKRRPRPKRRLPSAQRRTKRRAPQIMTSRMRHKTRTTDRMHLPKPPSPQRRAARLLLQTLIMLLAATN